MTGASADRYAVEPLQREGQAGVRIEPLTEAHAATVLRIYQAGIDEGDATFKTPSTPAFHRLSSINDAVYGPTS